MDKEIVREQVLALCDKRAAFLKAYAHLGCRRTSNPVDRLLRRLDYHLYCGQHLHGSTEVAERGPRGWALIHNFAPSCPWTVRRLPDLRSPAERLNGKRYHPEWLQNLCWSQPHSAGIAGLPEKRDKQEISTARLAEIEAQVVAQLERASRSQGRF